MRGTTTTTGTAGMRGTAATTGTVGMRGTAGMRERGSGALLMIAVVALAGFLTLVGGALAAAVVARHRAESAADLAALAAAGPSPAQCGPAEAVAAGNGAVLRFCRVLPDGSAVVGVSVATSGQFAIGAAFAQARAARPMGQATAPPDGRAGSLPRTAPGRDRPGGTESRPPPALVTRSGSMMPLP
jgi:secretion/DNA translocation related TadE-like protein